MVHAVYPGSFDPVTYGHLDIISRALRVFDKLTVAVLVNPQKKPMFTLAERKQLITESIATLSVDVTVDEFSGLLVDYAEKIKADVILRGLRAVSDFEFEFQLSLMNQRLNPRIDTVYLMARADLTYLSSGLVKEIAELGGRIEEFVPPAAFRLLKQKLI
jgi:pantetheine-phosphate adenylyltransferase